MATLKRKRVSKKTKKSWRKNVDVADVDDFLEEQRLEERLGQKLSDTKDSDLFTIDTSGISCKPLKENAILVKPVKRSMRLREEVTPKCFALLEKRSAVPDPIIKRNHVKQTEKIVKMNSRPFIKKVKPKKPKLNVRDLWSEEDKIRELGGLAEWMTADTVRNALQNTGHKRKLRPRGMAVKPSPLAAIEPPHPGMSYNPSLEDHKELIVAVATTEAEIEKKERHIHRVTTKMFRKVPREEAEKAWLTEMSVGIEQSSDSEAEMGDYSTVNPPVVRKKKTLKKRRKLREERELKKALEKKKMEKKKRADVNDRLTGIKKNIEKKENQSLKYQERKEERKKEKATDTKILGRTRFEAPPLEFQSPHELVGTLRQLKPEGSVLSDRFHSLQKRNVVEPTLKRNIRRAKVKVFVKPSHKMGWEPKGY